MKFIGRICQGSELWILAWLVHKLSERQLLEKMTDPDEIRRRLEEYEQIGQP